MSVEDQPELTDDERKELTYVSFLAHSVLRHTNEGTIQPCWLCMSADARADAVKMAVDWYNQAKRMLIPIQYGNEESMKRFEKMLESELGKHFIQWADMEMTLKRERFEGNPRAFFCPS